MVIFLKNDDACVKLDACHRPKREDFSGRPGCVQGGVSLAATASKKFFK
jgi:hypothetical protein